MGKPVPPSRRYPDDPRLAEAIGGHAEDHKTIRHPMVGDITVDCDVLVDTDTDLKIVVYTALPGSEDESKLRLAGVVGAGAGV
ncbi:hypothetical protein KGQ20_18235 [Catenulispora sp. NF23]|uniref:MmyB-like transcription regulator ligand binding domain-containing protein n=1 Tax=Catenulispora pinistramenti TaxID=2705254 RepID=A0ABS5KYJ2_9ACTN|nr:hypothetical protein [Catenulispora pinistramenti]MBS2534714.1 hypothetical protein [Catenulispora pinistramenti]MBS2551135.1 hypothetical protein [Catenulispora pinistramenti]